MKNTISTLTILVLIMGILTACQTGSTNTVTINEDDAGKTIELKTGDTLLVSLEGNMTTGFSWIPAPQDPVLLELVGDVTITPESDAVGAPGTLVLTFKATKTGQTTLHLDYKRSWEEGVTSEKVFDVTVVVK